MKYTVQFMNMTTYQLEIEAESEAAAIEQAQSNAYDLADLDTVGDPENDYFEIVEA